VLKLVLTCNNSSRISQVAFNFKFEELPETSKRAKNKKMNEETTAVKPDILAWTPFDKMVKTNMIEV
jgi:hypothetical protein